MICHSFLVLMFIKHQKAFYFLNIIMFSRFFKLQIWRLLNKSLLQLLLHILYSSNSVKKKLLNQLVIANYLEVCNILILQGLILHSLSTNSPISSIVLIIIIGWILSVWYDIRNQLLSLATILLHNLL